MSERVWYEIDRMLSASPGARFILLGVISLILIFICASLAMLVKGIGPHSAVWWALVRVIDTAAFGDEESYLSAGVAMLCALGGMLVVASLIGLVSSTLQEQFDELRKGRSKVFDTGHTLLVGYDAEKLRSILVELHNQCHSWRRAHTAVILCTEEKEEVENALADAIPDGSRLRLIVRKGSPSRPSDLLKCNAGNAAAIIVLNDELRHRTAATEHTIDMPAIKALLSLTQVPGALRTNHAVLEIDERERISTLEHIANGGRAEALVVSEALSRLMVQTSRQPGLAEVYADLLTFQGSQFYFSKLPQLEGLEYGQVQLRIYCATVCGFVRRDKDKRGKVLLNPDPHVKIQVDDTFLLLVPCDGIPKSFRLGPARVLDEKHEQLAEKRKSQATVRDSVFTDSPLKPKSECFVICGYSRKMAFMLQEFEAYVTPGSKVYVFPGISAEAFEKDSRMHKYKNLEVQFMSGDPTLPSTLEPLRRLKPTPNCVMVLSSDDVDSTEADAKTIITVLLVHKLMQEAGCRPRITCEILDQSSTDLLDKNVGCEFVLSTDLTSRMLAQVASYDSMNSVFTELLSPDGNEIYLKDAKFYCLGHGLPTPWLLVQRIATAVNETVIGYFQSNSVLNPPPNAIVTFKAGDKVIVLADDGNEHAC